MEKRWVVIEFPHLLCDRVQRRKPELKEKAFVLVASEHGKRVVKAVNAAAKKERILTGMVLADCKALVPDLEVLDYDAEEQKRTLLALAEWCIRFTPCVSVEGKQALILDASGCAHLWGGEINYLHDIHRKLQALGYRSRLAIADTIGAAWAVAHFGDEISLVETGAHVAALLRLPPLALRLDSLTEERLHKLGLLSIGAFINMPRSALRRRFGEALLRRLDQACGAELEMPVPICPPSPYEERLPAFDPVRTAEAIQLAIKSLLEMLCLRLSKEEKGLRTCELRSYRLDGQIQLTQIGTQRSSRNAQHLFKLFETKIAQIEPGLGIELFVLRAAAVEDLPGSQDALWTQSHSTETAVAELLDRIAGKTGTEAIRRFLPAQHHWPERAVKACAFAEPVSGAWKKDLPRPLLLLPQPERIEVSVPIPDYPPLVFRHKAVLHEVMKAEGPERIEQEWWIGSGRYRDYYCVENKEGARYWLFRSGDYDRGDAEWFLHGYFA